MKRILRIATCVLVVPGCSLYCFAQSHPEPVTLSTGRQQPASLIGTPDQTRDARPELQRRDPTYQLKPDDIIDLAFRFTPEFNQEVTVQPDGYIQVKGLSEGVHVGGLTVPQIVEALSAAYSRVLSDPVIAVVLKDFQKPYFVVGGDVKTPGKYDLRGDITVTEAIAIAGGFDEYAKHSQVLLFRRYNDDWVEVKTLDLRKMLKGKNTSEDVVLQPGEMLYVPKSAYAKVDRFLPRTSVGTYFNPFN